MHDLIIVGGGITAFGAAVYAGRFHLKTLVIGERLGGTILLTNEVENYPGFASISGQELFDRVREHAARYDIEVAEKRVERIEKKGKGFVVKSADGEYETKSVLIATGTEWRKLRIPGEEKFMGNGVHYCALCDGYAYQGKTIAVIGGSDSAAKEALLLSTYASKVYIIYRKEEIRAEPVTARRVKQNDKIEIIPDTMPVEFRGEKVLKSAVLDKPYNGNAELSLDGVFVAIGKEPLSELVKGLGVKLNEKQEILVGRYGETNVEGLFAAGDVTDSVFKQAITGVGQGVSAVFQIYRQLK